VALVVSILNGIFLFITIFFFSDPSGKDVSKLTYSILAVISGLMGTMAVVLASKALDKKMPCYRLSVAARWGGIIGIIGAACFLIFWIWGETWILPIIF
jgi:NADH:ubiquinone oxidoreductase subunit 4 (subunit M)